jgi:hypothetical protein
LGIKGGGGEVGTIIYCELGKKNLLHFENALKDGSKWKEYSISYAYIYGSVIQNPSPFILEQQFIIV